MEFTYSWFGLGGLIAGTTAWVSAVFVYRLTPNRRTGSMVAALLFSEGVLILTSYVGPAIWFDWFAETWFMRLHATNDFIVVALYLPTLAVVIDSPLLRPFRRLPGVLIPVVVGLAGVVAIAVAPPELVIAATTEARDGYPGPMFEPGPVWGLAFFLLAASYTYGFVATILAWWRADTPLRRRKNGFLALAFGVRDLTFGGLFIAAAVFTSMIPEPLTDDWVELIFQFFYWMQAMSYGLIIYILLMVYGVLSAQLFDIDLKVKWTIQRGTIVASFVAVFFIFSEGTEIFLSEQFGTLVGLIAAGALLFADAALQRWAERVANAALPTVQDTPEYAMFRKMQIYGEAVTSAVSEHGDFTSVDRSVLNRLRQQLGLSVDVASEMERDLIADRSNPLGHLP